MNQKSLNHLRKILLIKYLTQCLNLKIWHNQWLKNQQRQNHKEIFSKKVKDFIAKGDYEQEKVDASDAIRQKNMVKRYRVLSSKIETVADRLKTAYQNQRLSEQIQSLTNQLLRAGNEII